MGGKLVAKLICSFIVFGCILFLAYITTKFIGNKAKRVMSNKNMKIIESISLGVDKHIYIVKVFDKYLVLSACGKNINYLTEISSDVIEQNKDDTSLKNDGSEYGFSAILNRTLNKTNNAKSNYDDNQSKMFAGINRIKSSFSKLKASSKNGDGKFNE